MMFSRFSSAVLVSASLLALTACQSEIDNKPAAEVLDTAAQGAAPDGSTTPNEGGPLVTVPVIKEASSIGFIGAKVTRDHVGEFKNFDGSIEYAGTQPSRISFANDDQLDPVEVERLPSAKVADIRARIARLDPRPPATAPATVPATSPAP